MTDPYLGEIRILSFDFAPQGWAHCDGQLLPVSQNEALYALLDSKYGGDGVTTFALPDLRGRVPVHTGTKYLWMGEKGGEEGHTLVTAELPQHTHVPAATNDPASVADPVHARWANAAAGNFAPSGTATMASADVATTGKGLAHTNMSPMLVLNFCIALQGLWPSRT